MEVGYSRLVTMSAGAADDDIMQPIAGRLIGLRGSE